MPYRVCRPGNRTSSDVFHPALAQRCTLLTALNSPQVQQQTLHTETNDFFFLGNSLTQRSEVNGGSLVREVVKAARDSNPVQSARSRAVGMEFALRSGDRGCPRLRGVLISAVIYTSYDKSALCMGVELGLSL
jgi:hypothetical protein